MSTQAEALKQLLEKIERIESKVVHAKALNGAFEKLILTIDTVQENQKKMSEDISDIKKTVLDPDEGVIARVKELERWKSERAEEVVENSDEVRQDITIIKEWQKMVNKILWGIGAGVGSIALKLFVDVIKSWHPP